MSEQNLTDRYGNKIGSIRTGSNDIQTVHDKYGNKLGEYRPKQNTTHDKYGNKIGGGNLLASLVK